MAAGKKLKDIRLRRAQLEDEETEVVSLMKKFGRTYSEEARIELKDEPGPLFQLLVLSLLLSARIRAGTAVRAAVGLFENGWTSPAAMEASSWEQRVAVLNQRGYARYDESSARMLEQTTLLLQNRYHGDLRCLRDEAEGEPKRIRERLMEFKGIGDVGAGIFLREVQAVWETVYPYIDARARDTADNLGLPKTAKSLAGLVDGPVGMARLMAALIRIRLAGARTREEALALARS